MINRPTPERILAAAERELSLALQRLTACRNRLYRETGTYPDDLGPPSSVSILCCITS
jgi:hypothetical protein